MMPLTDAHHKQQRGDLRAQPARLGPRLLLLLVVNFATFAAICFASFRGETQRLREASAPIIPGTSAPAEKVIRLTEWVSAISPTVRNDHYFVLPSLRATPAQVLAGGGDCADKSRLLWAALRAQDIPATMVMLFDPHTERPTHTVVEAKIGDDQYMVADAAFNLVFPKPDHAGYYDLGDLRRDASILPARLDALIAEPGAPARLRAYRRDLCAYDRASSINWERNLITRFAFAALHPLLGESIYRVHRPVLLEEPKLAVAAGGTVVALLLLAVPPATMRVRCFVARLRQLSWLRALAPLRRPHPTDYVAH